MTWNYRLVKRHFAAEGIRSEPEDVYQIYEVHYNKNGIIICVTQTPSSPFGCTPEEIKADIARMTLAFEGEILNFEDLFTPEQQKEIDEGFENG